MNLFFFIINILSCIIFVMTVFLIKRRIKENNKRIEYDSKIGEIDNMDNFHFFEFIKKMYQESGYELSSEFDPEMIINAKKNNQKIGIKAILSNNDVGIRDIESIIVLIDKNIIDSGHILTNKKFTFPVIELAKIKNITLYDRKKLSKFIIELGIYPTEPKLHSKSVVH